MGRKKISRRMKSIVLIAGNDIARFDLDVNEKIIMSKRQKVERIKQMKKKINVILKQKSEHPEQRENVIQYNRVEPTIFQRNNEDSFPETSEISNNQVVTKSITVFINQYQEQPCEDLYISQLTHLFEINNQLQLQLNQ